MFEEFPKMRPPMPEALAQVHRDAYKANRRGETAASRLSLWMEGWLHSQVARDVRRNLPTNVLANLQVRSTLEIGAGTLNQLPYEPAVGPYDIVEPFHELYADSPLLARIRRVYDDITEIPATERYDRITSVATFEHLCDLPRVVANAGLRLMPGGELRVGIPSEGTPLWTLGWKLTTGLEFRLRHGLDYGLLLRHEHVNTAREVEQVLRHFFAEVRMTIFGLSRKLSLYQFLRCLQPRLKRCRSALKQE